MSWLLSYGKPALIAVLCGLAVWWFSHQRYTAGYSEADAAWSLKWQQRDADDATALAKRQVETRAEEQRRQGEIDAIEKNAEGQIAEAVADADRARAVSDGLHDEAAKLAARLAASERACRATTASGSAAGSTGSELLAELFRRADQRAGELAAIADQARIRGLTCETVYDALTGPNTVEK